MKVQFRVLLFAITGFFTQTSFAANSFHEALSSGQPMLDMRLRYESVNQDNALDDATSLTLRTRIGYETGDFRGFNALVEVEDSTIVLDQGDFTVGPTGYNAGVYSMIADPEVTEIDQSFIQYKSKAVKARLGRQVVALDNQRFIGHVGWRQDRQTFDGFTINYFPSKEVILFFGQLTQRNRIFAESADINSTDTLINAAFQTSFGKLVGYAYLLEIDDNTDNGLDTFGFSFNGALSSILYGFEFANQDSKLGGTEYSASYFMLTAGVTLDAITAKVSYESLGSDDGAFGFSTPLATLHKFNGWSDQFLGTPSSGLVDITVKLSGVALDGKITGAYHSFSADEEVSGKDDLGSEINLSYARKLNQHWVVGIKFSSYSAGDIAGKVDTDKVWLWLSAKI